MQKVYTSPRLESFSSKQIVESMGYATAKGYGDPCADHPGQGHGHAFGRQC